MRSVTCSGCELGSGVPFRPEKETCISQGFFWQDTGNSGNILQRRTDPRRLEPAGCGRGFRGGGWAQRRSHIVFSASKLLAGTRRLLCGFLKRRDMQHASTGARCAACHLARLLERTGLAAGHVLLAARQPGLSAAQFVRLPSRWPRRTIHRLCCLVFHQYSDGRELTLERDLIRWRRA